MKYIITILLCCSFFPLLAQPPQQKWNRQMQLKNCSIRVQSGQFTASTFVEMEFYNPNDQELEGLHQFELKPGQVITAFQLELNGKYRDGTLEEKWKATNAYNSIVGKRIDPALLSMDHNNFYSLRIYPVPAKGSRKITFTIQQLLTVEDGRISYVLPLNIPDTVPSFSLSIVSTYPATPQSGKGIITGQIFSGLKQHFSLNYAAHNIALKMPISFSVPLPKEPIICKSIVGNKNHFAIRVPPNVDSMHAINVGEMIVFWDASSDINGRDVEKEIQFLHQYIAYQSIRRLTIVPFNHRLLDTVQYDLNKANSFSWKKYLRNIHYSGATQLGCISVRKNQPGVLMLFTDGMNSYGKKIPATNGALLFCINSSPKPDLTSLTNIIGNSGGSLIDLHKVGMVTAIERSSKVQNWLLDITSKTGKTIIEQAFPMKVGNSILINGIAGNRTDTLLLHYGSSNQVLKVKEIILPAGAACDEPLISRISMLDGFDKLIKSHLWDKILDAGLQENMVTPNTAYIVLERVEDYIRYNIEAPKDLQNECEALRYVKSNTRIQRQKINDQDVFSTLSNVVNLYNQKFGHFNKGNAEITFSRQDIAGINSFNTKSSPGLKANEPNEPVAHTTAGLAGLTGSSNKLEEVVVTGYGMERKRSMAGAVTYIRGKELEAAQTVEQALQGRVAGLLVTQNSALPGAASSIIIRGLSSLNGNSQPLFVLDDIRVSGNINDLINVNNIRDITVLRSVQASALYGSDASNGVIIINSKTALNYSNYNYNRSYRLKDMEDVPYMLEIKEAARPVMMELYHRLQQVHAGNSGFYFDMAQHFFHKGLKSEALEILMEAAECKQGNPQVQHAVAYVLESWNQFDEAIVLYEQLVKDNTANLALRRDLAWMYYQAGYYQRAVNLFYESITLKDAGANSLSEKVNMLYEMNQVISMRKNKIDISKIPAALIKELASDLRIVLNSNNNNLGIMKIKEPGGLIAPGSQANSLLYGNDYWYHGNTSVYHASKPKTGKYKVSIDYYGYYQAENIPSFIRIKTFKNFGKKNQSIEIENVVMDNQYGEIEIATVNY